MKRTSIISILLLVLCSLQLTAKTKGEYVNLVCFVRFADDGPYFSKLKQEYETLFNSNGTGVASVYNYFKMSSYGQLDLTATFANEWNGSQVISYQDSHSRRSEERRVGKEC